MKHPAGVQGPRLWNSDAFGPPQGLTYGTAGRNILNLPARTNFDMGLFKSFAVHEDMHFEFRAEAFNVFNHTQWSQVNNNSCYGGLFRVALPYRNRRAQRRVFCSSPVSLSSEGDDLSVALLALSQPPIYGCPILRVFCEGWDSQISLFHFPQQRRGCAGMTAFAAAIVVSPPARSARRGEIHAEPDTTRFSFDSRTMHSSNDGPALGSVVPSPSPAIS